MPWVTSKPCFDLCFRTCRKGRQIFQQADNPGSQWGLSLTSPYFQPHIPHFPQKLWRAGLVPIKLEVLDPEEFRGDRDVVMKAASRDGYALAYTAEHLLSDFEIVKESGVGEWLLFAVCI